MLIAVQFDPDEWGTVADWVESIGTVLAFLVTFLLLRHEIRARQATEAEQAAQRQRGIARRQLGLIRPMQEDYSEHAIARERCAQLGRDIEADRFEIADQTLSDRLAMVRQVAVTLGWDEAAFEQSASSTRPTTRAFATVRFRKLLASAALSLEHYITGRPLPPWPASLPNGPANAQAWILTAPKGT